MWVGVESGGEEGRDWGSDERQGQAPGVTAVQIGQTVKPRRRLRETCFHEGAVR